MRTFLVLLLTVCLASCDEPVKVELRGDGYAMCLVDSVVYKAAYDAQYQLQPYVYSKIIIIKWKESIKNIDGHAITVFIINTRKFPNPKYDKMFIYDRRSGSREVPIKYKDKPLSIANYLYGQEKVEWAKFLE